MLGFQVTEQSGATWPFPVSSFHLNIHTECLSPLLWFFESLFFWSVYAGGSHAALFDADLCLVMRDSPCLMLGILIKGFLSNPSRSPCPRCVETFEPSKPRWRSETCKTKRHYFFTFRFKWLYWKLQIKSKWCLKMKYSTDSGIDSLQNGSCVN